MSFEIPDSDAWREEMGRIAEVLLGAAYADGQFVGAEKELIIEFLAGLLEVESLPAAITDRLDAFDVATFDVAKTLQELNYTGPDQRRFLLTLIAGVADADQIREEAEDAYLAKVATLIGASEEEYLDLLGEPDE